MSNYKVEFTLKQHTPIIHFQSEQNGATLRATELKPKFDRFLIDKVFKKDKSQYEKYLIDKDKDALDYKVNISPVSKVNFSLINEPKIDNYTKKQETDRDGKLKWLSYPNYFANMGDDTGKTHKKFSKIDTIKVIFKTFDTGLLLVIQKWFPLFLLHNNFGTRQTKGFGSFSLDSSDSRYSKNLPSQLLAKNLNFFIKGNIKKTFEAIDLFYKTIRSGINQLDRNRHHEYYFKSAIFMYAKHNDIIWDKRAIKQKFISESKLNQEISEHNSPDILTTKETSEKKQLIMRDLLGLSTSQQWGNSFELTKISDGDNIVRMKSPILFKPIKEEDGFRIYFILSPFNPSIIGKEFKIQTSKHGETALNINFPDTDKNLSTSKFLSYVIHNINPDTHVDEKFHGFRSHELIKDIYEQLQTSLQQILQAQKASK